MLIHEFFHEQAHLEKNHELKRRILFIAICLISAFLYRFFCRLQEYEADRIAAKKCGKDAAVESLKLLQMREGKPNFWFNLFSLHPSTEKRLGKFI